MINREHIPLAKMEIRHRIMQGEHYLATGLLLGVIPTEEDVEKAAIELLTKRAEQRQKEGR